MIQRVKLLYFIVIGIAAVCSVIRFSNFRYSPASQYQVQKTFTDRRSIAEQSTRIDEVSTQQLVIDLQRRDIREQMRSYPYPCGKYNKTAEKLEDLLIEENGKPIRSVILTTWRSGSTFLGDVIDQHPANFYHYEPLLDFDIVQVRGPPLDSPALTRVKALFNCDYSKLASDNCAMEYVSDDYIEYGKTHSWVFNHNTYLWKQCKRHKKFCYDPDFLSAMCKLFPFQSMKPVRLRLNVAQKLLADRDLDLRMVFLVRDPRGTLQSRKHRDWCPGVRDCSDPGLVCADLVADYKIAVELRKKYPITFRVIRYEDLSAQPYERVAELSQFFGIDFHPRMKKFLTTHTDRNIGGVSSTFRDSQQAPYHWTTELTFEEVDAIQRSCATAMEYWGYVPATNATHQKDFIPVTEYRLS